MQYVLSVLETVPQPTPSAPAGVSSAVERVLGMILYGSIAAATAIFLAMGIFAWSGDRGMSGGLSPEMKSKGTAAIIGLVIATAASSLVQFLT